ncbi:MAG: Metalloprotease [Chlamydiales bacterium]|jgi:Zn-dependent M16 (insulinase) family peptidase|nr:Metalloprotease [Chlamydiales bacterium]
MENGMLFNQVGAKYRGFQVVKKTTISELQCELYELVHGPTGAQVLYIGNKDPENLFCLSFRTWPDSSNGVAHILEHTVLCGSKRFPVKDPFFSMNRRSLNTFMNAFTGADFTCYPAASQVPKDFYNLLDVYLDAVFNPLLNEKSFLQEGHRLEFAISEDPTSSLEYKGIVYNEMKGALVSGDSRLWHAMLELLCPDLTYKYNSGGDPQIIPTLTYEQLKQFHKNYYHPSRCLFYFYGNLPLKQHLDFISERVLDKTTPIAPLSEMPRQMRFTKPIYEYRNYPIAPDETSENKTIIGMSWLTCPITNQEDILGLELLELILMDTDASPLKKVLLASGLCTQAEMHLESEMTEMMVSLIFKGANQSSTEPLDRLVRSTLAQIAKEGFAVELIEAALHQIEFQRCEITGDSDPFGLTLFFRAGLLKQQGAEAEDGLKVHSLFKRLHELLQDQRYFSSLIDKYFLNNNHFVCVTMVPDQQLSKKELEEEQQRLQAITAGMTPEQKTELVIQAEKLTQFQTEQEENDLSVLPKIQLSEVPKEAKDYSLKEEQFGALNVFYHDTFTNHIVYTDLVFELPEIKQAELPWLRLLSIVLTEVGTANRSYEQILNDMQAYTGGVTASLSLHAQAHDANSLKPSFNLSVKALKRNTTQLFSILQELITQPNFSQQERMKEIMAQHYTDLEQKLSSNAMRYAMHLAASRLTTSSMIQQQWYGLDYFYFIRDLMQNWDAKWSLIQERLSNYSKLIFGQKASIIIAADSDTYLTLIRDQLNILSKTFNEGFFSTWHSNNHSGLDLLTPQGIAIASPVAFTAQYLPGLPYTHSDAPYLSLAAQIMDNIILHAFIREQGGAYGCGAAHQAALGLFYLYSYRDPNIASTLVAFDQAIDTIANGDFDEEDIEEAQLGLLQHMDSPIAPGSRGFIAFCWNREGKTQELRQSFREKILRATTKDIQAAVRKHLVENRQHRSRATFAGKDLLLAENEKLCTTITTPYEISSI